MPKSYFALLASLLFSAVSHAGSSVCIISTNLRNHEREIMAYCSSAEDSSSVKLSEGYYPRSFKMETSGNLLASFLKKYLDKNYKIVGVSEVFLDEFSSEGKVFQTTYTLAK